jgi:hypothetical protein
MNRRHVVSALFTSLVSANLLRAGSVDRLGASADDVAQELGLELMKYRFQWERPVFAKYTLVLKSADKETVESYEEYSAGASAAHDIRIALKDIALLRDTLGLPATPDSGHTREISLRATGISFALPHREIFPELPGGQVYRKQSVVHSREELPLGVPIALVTQAGPYSPSQAAPRSLAQEFILMPAFLSLAVEFRALPFSGH